MKVEHIKYLLVYSLPMVIFISIYFAGWWSFLALVFLFGFIPFVELFMNGSTENMDELEEAVAKEDRFYDYLLYGLVPAFYVLLGLFLFRFDSSALALYEKVGLTTALGMGFGLAINTAHELGHRNTWYEQMMSKMLLLLPLYMHFFIEHNRGHHKNVATEDDPASSRYGETIYAFFVRTVTGSWMSAWHLEKERLERAQQPFWSFHNEMLRFQLIQAGFVLLIGLSFGWTILVYYLISAVLGFLLLETVNYIEHYGLRRRKKGTSYERTLPIHSWNSNHPLGRILLLELSRHSDHHYMANRKYQILRHFDESPQMPTGYPGMMLLSLIPPLWFAVMHRRIAFYRETVQGVSLA